MVVLHRKPYDVRLQPYIVRVNPPKGAIIMVAKRTPLTARDILVTALRIIDEEGADALSMRHLARELGVEAMSLYHHFPNKDAILEGVVVLALEAEAPPAPVGAGWEGPVRAAVLGFRRVLVNHPNVLPVMAAHPPTTPGTSAYIEGPLRFLLATAFAPADASDLFQAVFALAFGHAMLSTSYTAIEQEGLPSVRFTETSFSRTLDVLLEGYGRSLPS
jgi:AcrR family transcriptional regulator